MLKPLCGPMAFNSLRLPFKVFLHDSYFFRTDLMSYGIFELLDVFGCFCLIFFITVISLSLLLCVCMLHVCLCVHVCLCGDILVWGWEVQGQPEILENLLKKKKSPTHPGLGKRLNLNKYSIRYKNMTHFLWDVSSTRSHFLHFIDVRWLP